MKKIICALFGGFLSLGAYADGGRTVVGSDSYYGMEGTRVLFIPRIFFENIQEESPTLSKDVVSAMLAKYDELAETEAESDAIGSFLEGQNPLTVHDLEQICKAGGIQTKDACSDLVVNPIFGRLGAVRFENVCLGTNTTGGQRHCVDDVFIKEYEITEVTKGEVHNARKEVAEGKEPRINFHSDGLVLMGGDNYRYDTKTDVTHESGKSYAQDVEVGTNAAFGLAIEYAKLHGHSVLCDSRITNNWINCTTPDNKHFYTFRFKDANVNDRYVSHSLESGLCALFGKDFHGLPASHGYVYCKEMNCTKGTVPGKVIPKFGVDIVDQPWVDKEHECRLDNRENYRTKDEIRTYPGYEDMSYAFKEVQAVYDYSLRQVLEIYVKTQGVRFNSFECEYGTRPLAYRDSAHGSMPYDDIVTCYIDGTPVDFVFDDLFETKELAKQAGLAGTQCLMMKSETGRPAKYDGKYCKVISIDQCLGAEDVNGERHGGLNDVVPGGTRWDEKAGACVLNKAEEAEHLNTKLWLVGGVVFSVGVVILSGGTALIAIVAVAGEVGAQALADQIQRQIEVLPYSRVTEFLDAAKLCDVGSDISLLEQCSLQQRQCSYDAVQKFYVTLNNDDIPDDVIDRMNYFYNRLSVCISDEDDAYAKSMAIDVQRQDAVKMNAGVFVMIGSSFIGGKARGVRSLSKARKIFSGMKAIRSNVSTASKFTKMLKKDASMINSRKGWVMELKDDFTGQNIVDISDDLSKSGFHHVMFDKDGNYVELFDGAGKFVGKDAIEGKAKYIFYSLDDLSVGFGGVPKANLVVAGKASFGTTVIRDGPEYLKAVTVTAAAAGVARWTGVLGGGEKKPENTVIVPGQPKNDNGATGVSTEVSADSVGGTKTLDELFGQ